MKGNMVQYVITQDAHINQKDRLNVLISLNLNFSSSDRNLLSLTPSYTSAFLSIMAKILTENLNYLELLSMQVKIYRQRIL
jgi:hypothetical protein